jgi:LmbE family N-acetylglucosaminyl deacetylase
VTTTGAPQGTAQLLYRLIGLGMAGSVLHIGTHPDDEDVGLLAYLVRKYGVRAVYWSATRGEGGQNRLNSYRDEALGVYRTWESLAARAVDGGECLYGPFYDFGYSKTGEEALARWGRTAVVREIVRAIRLVQPHVVVARWQGGPGDFHGQHQAVGLAARDAFEAAGDPEQFPELTTRGLPPWQPLKLYHSMDNSGGDMSAGAALNLFGHRNPALERDGVLRINTGEFDPIAGRTYQEQAWIAYNEHQSQGMGLIPAPGDFFYYFCLSKSLVAVPDREITLFDGLDPSLTGLSDHPGGGCSSLRMLADVKARAGEAVEKFRRDDPLGAATSVLEGRCALRRVRDDLSRENLPAQTRRALDVYLARKLADFEELAARCLGLELECLSERSRIIPGQQFRLSARLWSHRGVRIDRTEFAPSLPAGWRAQSVDPGTPGADAPDRQSAAFDVVAAETADLTCPYWLAEPRTPYAYAWPEGEPAGRPFGPDRVGIECVVVVGRDRITMRTAAVRREAFSGGFRELPLAVIPPISLHPHTGHEFLPVTPGPRTPAGSGQEQRGVPYPPHGGRKEQQLQLHVVARNNSDQAVQGSLALEVPHGWSVAPERSDLVLAKPGDTKTVRFTVTVPASSTEGQYWLRYTIRYGGRDYGVVVAPVRMAAPGLAHMTDASNCVREEFIVSPAQVVVHLIDADFAAGLRYGYVQGAGDELEDALRPFGVDFHQITDADIGHLDLSAFDVIVIGPNAYVLRGELRSFAGRFLEYVEQGGTLIVQYQGYPYETAGLAPYPLRYHQPHDRVTREDAPVSILDPDHVLFRLPNTIRTDDFDRWVRERGLYFPREWDPRYEPLLACSDPGEEPRKGGLLLTTYGRGAYLYTGYSFFRQLPAGVPGAFRLFANILGLPAARILERIEFLKRTFLFSSLTDAQLEPVARSMSGRWIPAGAYICRQGEVGRELYMVSHGEVEIIREANGRHELVHLAQAGACIGEMAVLGDLPRTASMRARGDVNLLVLDWAGLQPLLQQHPDVSIRLIHILVHRLVDTMESLGP